LIYKAYNFEEANYVIIKMFRFNQSWTNRVNI